MKPIIIAILALIAHLGVADSYAQSPALKLSVESSKNSYLLGEPVEVKFSLLNTGDKDVDLDCFGIGTGEVGLWIGREGRNPVDYNPGTWGIVDALCFNKLKPGESLDIPGVKVLMQMAGTGTRSAFPVPGQYSLKTKAIGLESTTITITIVQPTGDDATVWDLIKDREDIAYFLQNSDLPSYNLPGGEREALLNDVESIIHHYPITYYAEALAASLKEFRIRDARRKAMRSPQ